MIAIDFNVVLVTVSVLVESVSPPEVTWIVIVPGASALATPAESITATSGADDAHLTEGSTFVLAPLTVPVATNRRAKPTGRGSVGAIAIDSRVTLVTVSVADPVIDPAVAEMLALPAALVVARPELLTVATPVAFDAHVTVARS